MVVEFRLNGRAVRLEASPDRRLLWVLRTDFGLTGAKYGCGSGACGACTVLLNGEAVRSCQTQVRDLAGAAVTTIEGITPAGKLHPLQEAFVEHGALQCGFCTPGMVLSAHALLARNAHPTPEQIIEGLEENLCRCGAHRRIVLAVQSAAEKIGGAR